ncbi:glycosyltransferase family 2 protein [Tropicimonas marinistellae]|uniref:glycosyltransferase family 2 protein n=1 Tax=Tropicimonas marinistellae TaxID=1739787 RepID=UPI0008362ED7|nr:glycosyltransferase family 2 protein [Tropicimonas marinistellae]
MNSELLQIVQHAKSGASGFTLSALMRNEIYFLPAFLDHYRRLGVDHFVLLDDASDDGAREYALAQPDVTLLRSPYRYGDELTGPDGRRTKAKMLWRRELLSRWSDDCWTLHVDIDEFIDLPDGMSFPALAARLEREGHDLAYGAMVDMYPINVHVISELRSDVEFSPQQDWYFDAVPHLLPHPFGPPLEIYGGARERLCRKYGIRTKPIPPARRLTNLFYGQTAPFLHRLRKAAFVKWNAGRKLRNEHSIAKARSARIVLPIRHYKFTPALVAKVEFALATGAYTKNSGQYRLLDRLLATMAAGNGSFLCNSSHRYTGFDAFQHAGIARGF